MRVGLESVPLVQEILKNAPAYFKKVDGSPVLEHFATREIGDKPLVRSKTYEKAFLVVYLGETPIGVADLHKDHPAAGRTYLGLLLLDENFQGQGLGRQAYLAIEKFARTELGASLLILGVSEKNDVTAFWQKMGFKPNGDSYVWKGERSESKVIEMEKSLF